MAICSSQKCDVSIVYRVKRPAFSTQVFGATKMGVSSSSVSWNGRVVICGHERRLPCRSFKGHHLGVMNCLTPILQSRIRRGVRGYDGSRQITGTKLKSRNTYSHGARPNSHCSAVVMKQNHFHVTDEELDHTDNTWGNAILDLS